MRKSNVSSSWECESRSLQHFSCSKYSLAGDSRRHRPCIPSCLSFSASFINFFAYSHIPCMYWSFPSISTACHDAPASPLLHTTATSSRVQLLLPSNSLPRPDSLSSSMVARNLCRGQTCFGRNTSERLLAEVRSSRATGHSVDPTRNWSVKPDKAEIFESLQTQSALLSAGPSGKPLSHDPQLGGQAPLCWASAKRVRCVPRL